MVILPLTFLEVLDTVVGITQYQVVQTKRDRIVVKLVKGKDYTPKTSEEVRSKVANLLGETFEVEVTLVDEIKKEPSGKIKVVKSLVT